MSSSSSSSPEEPYAAPASEPEAAPRPLFTGYEKFVIAVLAFLQFTVVLDFMILSPLGAILMEKLHIGTEQFGKVVSGYAFAAGISGLLAAGFADRFDRKKLLLFFYTGFLVGTLFCALAPNYQTLLAARIFTGFFGGVIGSVSMAILADVFDIGRRGRVMGFVQSAFSAAQVLGLPIGLWLAARFGWHYGFLMIVAVGTVVGLGILVFLRPVNAHLSLKVERSPMTHLWKTGTQPKYLVGFAAMLLISTGGFMLMPFGSAFSIHNLGIPLEKLPLVYMITGVFTLIAGPLLGRASDALGKYRMMCVGTAVSLAAILIYVRLGITPMWEVILLNVVLYCGISARMVSAGALNSAMPDLADRGAYMSISSSLQQMAGGVASWAAGKVVVQESSGRLGHYPELGWLVTGSMLLCLALMYGVHRSVASRSREKAPAEPLPDVVMEA